MWKKWGNGLYIRPIETFVSLLAAVIRSQVNTPVLHAGVVSGFMDVDKGTGSHSLWKAPKQLELKLNTRTTSTHWVTLKWHPEWSILPFCIYKGELEPAAVLSDRHFYFKWQLFHIFQFFFFFFLFSARLFICLYLATNLSPFDKDIKQS